MSHVRSLTVTGINPATPLQEISDLFEQDGRQVDRVLRDGRLIVVMASDVDAEAAESALNGSRMPGQLGRLKVTREQDDATLAPEIA